MPKEEEKVAKQPIHPVVGTYMIHFTDEKIGHQQPIRFYADGSVLKASSRKSKWEQTDNGIRVYHYYRRWIHTYTVELTKILNSPALISTELGKNHSSGNFEAIRLSTNPDYPIDHYVIGSNKGPDYKKKFYCFNVGRQEFPYQQLTVYGVKHPAVVPRYAKSAAECAALCEKMVIDSYGSLAGRSCPGS